MKGEQEQKKSSIGAFGINMILRFRWVFLLAVLTILGILCSQMKLIRQVEDPLMTLYPADHPYLEAIKALNRLSPTPNVLVAILNVRQGDIFTAKTIEKIDAITKALQQMPGVIPDGVVSLTSRKLVHADFSAEGLNAGPIIGGTLPKTDEALEALRRRVAVNGMANGIYISRDRTAAMFTAPFENRETQIEKEYREFDDQKKKAMPLEKFKSKKEKEFQANLLKAVQEMKTTEEDVDHSLLFMGGELLKAQMTQMGSQIGLAMLGMLIVIVVFLGVYFRTVQGVVIPFVAMQFALLWGMGLFGCFIQEFNPMALLAPLFFAVFALVLSVMILNRYSCLYRETHDKQAAIRKVYAEFPLGLWSIFPGIAIAGLYPSGIPMLTQLSCFGLIWVTGTFVCIMVIVPVLISFFRPPVTKGVSEKSSSAFQGIGGFGKTGFGMGKVAILIVLAGILAGGAISINRLPAGNNVPGASYIPAGHPWNQCFQLFSEKFIGPNEFAIYVRAKEPGGLRDAQVINDMGDFCAYLNTVCGARMSVSLNQIIKAVRSSLMEGYPKWQVIPDLPEDIARSASIVISEPGMEKFMDKTWTEATLSTWPDKTGPESIETFTSKAQGYIRQHPSEKFSYRLGSGLVGQTKAINDGAQKAYPVTVAAALAIVFLLGILVTRSLRLAVLMVIPLIAAQCLLFIVMAWLNIPISLSIVPSGAVSVGLGAVLAYPLVRSFKSGGENGFVPIILFAGVLISVLLAPLSLIQMKFQENMALMLSVAVILETLSLIVFAPVLKGVFLRDGK